MNVSPPWPIPYLSPKAFDEYAPEEYRGYVKSLYRKRSARRTPSVKLKKVKPPFVAKLGKRGPLITVNRKPKWLSREEIDSIAKDLGLPLNEVWLCVLKKRKDPIRVSTKEDEDRIAQSLKELDEVWPKV